jgi:hypothetical protein
VKRRPEFRAKTRYKSPSLPSTERFRKGFQKHSGEARKARFGDSSLDLLPDYTNAEFNLGSIFRIVGRNGMNGTGVPDSKNPLQTCVVIQSRRDGTNGLCEVKPEL